MVPGRDGPRPCADARDTLDRSACPGLGIDYPRLYDAHYGAPPPSWLTGVVQKVRTGHAADPEIRLAGASGGVITRVLQYLLETGRIDGAVVARQGVPSPMEASAVIAMTPQDMPGTTVLNGTDG
jgi:coenzyme F420 hydrogenase subunit beta